MKIVKTEGCVVNGICIDDTDISYMNEDTKQNSYNKILEYLKNNYSEQMLIQLCDFITSELGTFEYLYTCEQCGDAVYEYKIEI